MPALVDASEDPPGAAMRDARVLGLIGTGHFLSHFYMLCLAPLFPVWRDEFGVSYGALGLVIALMSATTGLLQTPVGFWVDRYGARRFLVGGTLLMALAISAMAFAPGYWALLVLAIVSGIGNSVIHPADYAILTGSVRSSFMGRAFSVHTFTGNLGFMMAPIVIGLLSSVMDWRNSLLLVGLLGLPVVAGILWQSKVLKEQARPRKESTMGGRELLLSRPMLLFFGFFMLSAMAGAGVQSFIVTVMAELWGMPVAIGGMVLTGYMVGATAGTLVGGWLADSRKGNLIGIVILLTLGSMGMLLALGLVSMPAWLAMGVAFAGGLALGTSRTPRDLMLKDASPPGEVGKVFGFVSAGLPLGGAIMPVPLGLLIDAGYPVLVLPVVAGVLGLSLLCAGNAQGSRARRSAVKAVPAE
ncbi:MAG: transporter [Rhodospirillales bacterium]|jgi:MFS family permease|nr:transporter [Rhodospirillales bacterium]